MFISLMGFDIFTGSISDLVKSSLNQKITTVINTINPHSYILQKTDESFKNALKRSDYIIPDGYGIVLAAKFLNQKEINRITGYDLFVESMKQANEKSLTVLFFGSSHRNLTKIKAKAKKEYPKVNIVIFSPPFKDQFNSQDLADFNNVISQNKPDIIFFGLTAPKQEKLINLLEFKNLPSIVAGIGAVFDFYSGSIKRPSQFWINLKLEWFIRLLKEPLRLFKRNFKSTPLFLFEMVKCKIKLKKI